MSPAPELKATLTLPQTAFPMKANLPQNEPLRLARWASLRLYDELRKAGAGRPAYILHDGPPYANGPIHLGHALNKGLKDFVVKSRTMAGFDSPYVPGIRLPRTPNRDQGRREIGPPKTRDAGSTGVGCMPRVCANVCGYANLAIRAHRVLRTVGQALQDHVPRLRGAHPGGLLRFSRERVCLPRTEAGLLVYPRPNRPGRGRSRVRDAHQPVDLRALPAHVGPGRRSIPPSPAAKSTPSSGRPLPGPCPRRSPLPSIPISITSPWQRPTKPNLPVAHPWPRQRRETTTAPFTSSPPNSPHRSSPPANSARPWNIARFKGREARAHHLPASRSSIAAFSASWPPMSPPTPAPAPCTPRPRMAPMTSIPARNTASMPPPGWMPAAASMSTLPRGRWHRLRPSKARPSGRRTPSSSPCCRRIARCFPRATSSTPIRTAGAAITR